MVLVNDTRGWIMSCVSGLGKSPQNLIPDILETHSFHGSLRRRVEHYLCRSNHPAHSGETQLPHSGQQYFSILQPKFELRRDGMFVHFLDHSSACIDYALALFFSVQHASLSQELSFTGRNIAPGCCLLCHRLLSRWCRRHPSCFTSHASLHSLSCRGLSALPRREQPRSPASRRC